jgi:hypothetical protein
LSVALVRFTFLVSGYVGVLLLLALLGIAGRVGADSFLGLSWQAWSILGVLVCAAGSAYAVFLVRDDPQASDAPGPADRPAGAVATSGLGRAG